MSNLASQFEKTMMADAFLEHVDQLLTVAYVLQWFKTAGSGVDWPELATVEKECLQLYERYKGEEWVCPFDVHFAPVNSFLEFLMDDLTVGMMVSALAVASASNTAKHLVGALAVARGEGWSEGRGDDEAANRGDIQEEQIEEMFTNKYLTTLLHWQKASTVVDTGLGAGVKLEKAKEKVMVSLEKRQEYKCTQGVCDNCWADNDPEGCCGQSSRSTGGKFAKKIATKAASEEAVVGGSGGAKVKSREVVESDEDDTSPALVASAKRLQTVANEEGERDVEMRETTPLAIVAEVEREASNMEVEGEEELEAVPAMAEEDKEEERAEEVEGTWTLLADFDKRAAGVEWQFQRKLEAAKEELLAARAHYTVVKQTLVTLAGYWHDCQAFLAWQEENNIGEGDWEEAEAMEVPDNDAALNA
ncbi:hypothetical protein J132_06135 [Termitomyces sp. J132]|nr:hypothetical protein J132_06135 [Termitomyces sp. J132]